MDASKRQITKIAREVSKLTLHTMREEGIGTAEFDFIHLVRHNPGITQAEIREKLKIDKGAAARRAASIEAKGFLTREKEPIIISTEKAEKLRNSKAGIEAVFYEWLLAELPEDERTYFCQVLNTLYERSKRESRNGFPNVTSKLQVGGTLE